MCRTSQLEMQNNSANAAGSEWDLTTRNPTRHDNSQTTTSQYSIKGLDAEHAMGQSHRRIHRNNGTALTDLQMPSHSAEAICSESQAQHLRPREPATHGCRWLPTSTRTQPCTHKAASAAKQTAASTAVHGRRERKSRNVAAAELDTCWTCDCLQWTE
jgi:hypothetical protein